MIQIYAIWKWIRMKQWRYVCHVHLVYLPYLSIYLCCALSTVSFVRYCSIQIKQTKIECMAVAEYSHLHVCIIPLNWKLILLWNTNRIYSLIESEWAHGTYIHIELLANAYELIQNLCVFPLGWHMGYFVWMYIAHLFSLKREYVTACSAICFVSDWVWMCICIKIE